MPWKLWNHGQRTVLGMMWGKYADSKSHVPYSRGAKVKAEGVAAKVPAAMKEPRPGPDLHFAPGSFGELPGLVACHEISRGVGKGNQERRKRQDRDWVGRVVSTVLHKVGSEAPDVRGDKPHPTMDGEDTAPHKASTVPGRLWEKMCVLNFAGKGEHDEYKSHHTTCGRR